MQEQRRLAAILFADIQGYTSLMQKDEETAIEILDKYHSVLESEVGSYQGKVVKNYGDGSVCLFPTALSAVHCSIAIQEALRQDTVVPLRIGLHLGDVLQKREDYYGDSLNIASRLESMGVPGSIIISKKIRDEVKNKPGISLTLLGKYDFKNVDEEMEIYAISNPGLVVPEKGKMKGKLKEKKKPGPVMKFSVAALIVVVLGFLGYQYLPNHGDTALEIPKLAVLAFENIGDSTDNYFARGITEELNERLSGLQNLAVISRSSSRMFAGSSLSPVEIGRELGADYVLEGSVNWKKEGENETINIKPRLLKVNDNTEVWTSNLERVPQTALNVQSLIALQLTKELNLAMTSEEEFRINDSPTDNPLAYDAWLRGLKVMPNGHGSKEDYHKAYELFTQAVTLDSSFARAWISLSRTHSSFYWFGYDTRKWRLDTALAIINKAAILEPGLHEIKTGRANYHYQNRDYDNALNSYSVLLKERPNDPEILRRVAFIWRRQGLIQQAIETLEKTSTLDPLNNSTCIEIAWTSIFLKDFEKAIKYREEALVIDPNGEWNYLMGAFIYWNRAKQGDLKIAHDMLENVPKVESSYPAWFWITQYIFEGNYDAALNKVENLIVPAIEKQDSYLPKPLLLGEILELKGENQKAQVEYEKAVKIMEEKIQEYPDDFRMFNALGMAYAGLGMKDEAMEAGEKAVELLPLSKDALMGLDAMMGLTRIYAKLGEDNKALDVIAQMYAVPCPYRGMFFTHDPVFRHLQDNPRFIDLLNRKRNYEVEPLLQ